MKAMNGQAAVGWWKRVDDEILLQLRRATTRLHAKGFSRGSIGKMESRLGLVSRLVSFVSLLNARGMVEVLLHCLSITSWMECEGLGKDAMRRARRMMWLVELFSSGFIGPNYLMWVVQWGNFLGEEVTK